MSGASKLKLKATCAKCKKEKWCVDYREGSYANIHHDSICLFCEGENKLDKEIRAIKEMFNSQLQIIQKEVKERNDKVENLEKEVKNLKLENQELKKRLCQNAGTVGGSSSTSKKDSTSSPVVQNGENAENQSRKSNLPVNNNTNDERAPSTEDDSVIIESEDLVENTNEWQVAGEKKRRRKQNKAQKNKSKEKKPEVHKNKVGPQKKENSPKRSGPISDKESKTFLVGDSQVRGQESHFSRTRTGIRKVKSLPGAKTSQISREVEKIWVKDRGTAVIAQVSGNDLFLRGKKSGETENIIGEVMTLVDELYLKTDRAMILGILPRIFASSWSTSKAIGINARLADLCTQKGVRFVDPFDHFYGKANLYLRDGVHLSETGKAKLGDLLNDQLFSMLRSSGETRAQNRSQPSQSQSVGHDRVSMQQKKKKTYGKKAAGQKVVSRIDGNGSDQSQTSDKSTAITEPLNSDPTTSSSSRQEIASGDTTSEDMPPLETLVEEETPAKSSDPSGNGVIQGDSEEV